MSELRIIQTEAADGSQRGRRLFFAERPSAAQFRAARAMLGWTQIELAVAANLSPNVICNLERDNRMAVAGSIEKLVSSFTSAGIRFTPTGVELADFSEMGV